MSFGYATRNIKVYHTWDFVTIELYPPSHSHTTRRGLDRQIHAPYIRNKPIQTARRLRSRRRSLYSCCCTTVPFLGVHGWATTSHLPREHKDLCAQMVAFSNGPVWRYSSQGEFQQNIHPKWFRTTVCKSTLANVHRHKEDAYLLIFHFDVDKRLHENVPRKD